MDASLVTLYPLRFIPLAVERLWGGTALEPLFPDAERSGDGRHPIGEVWTLVTHPTHASRVANGPHRGRTLTELIAEAPERMLGALAPADRFPLLVKFIDAAQDLSVQVHPDDAYARRHENDWGKSEAWYILKAPEGGRIIAGHRFDSPDTYRRAVAEGRIREYLLEQPIAAGELVYIPAGRVHALLGGTTVIEIQQPSDVTYRIYDWDRIDPVSGRPRPLHVDKAADVIRYGDASVAEKSTTALRTPFFTLEKHALAAGERRRFAPVVAHRPEVIVVADGEGGLVLDGREAPPREGTADGPPGRTDDVTVLALRPGDTILVPADIPRYTVRTAKALVFLRAIPGPGGEVR
ncbi:type I phosphomannose isomerase catalytic subunit [Hydrogenibacillus schlegelii]|nr:type I phosphomannose isomerase catalytic subunit [Hydrogenibacillus schlegelii]KWW97287.1 hypothetical protein TR75_09440 [Hydrogenibacillus schlegelii]MBT9282210.1 class I mannose-6-phosphate isomerase [Hydrogenibacillus schlegelii]OAR05567.1 hypothetical protein SA87_11885 [Hydrogenibacillus schlegelii]